MYTIYTIIVTYNGAPWIEKCLQHLLNSSYPTKIIVVDNCSTDNTTAILRQFYDKIVFIQAESNLGFGRGNNLGILKALDLGADYVFLLNQDAYADQYCIEKLMEAYGQHKQYGIISPLQLNSDGSDLDPAFKKYMNIKGKFNFDLQYKVVEVRFVNAAAWMIPVNVIKKVGVFHEAFSHYGEDNHYCSRIQYHGYKSGICTQASVIHDRPIEKLSAKTMIRQLRTVPLYTLLDIRKNFILAWALGFYKLSRFKKKLQPYFNSETKKIYEEQKKWFLQDVDLAKQIRKETKKDASV